METNYNELAENFASKHVVKMEIIGEPIYKKHFIADTHYRYVFKIKLTRNEKSFTFDFGQSVAKARINPTLYDVLSCLTKTDVGTYNDFIKKFGYPNNITWENLYKITVKEYYNVVYLFSDILDELQEIY